MTLTNVLMVLAILTGPVIAVQLTRYLDNKKECRGRKLSIFKTLMATRSYGMSQAHVEALNRIDLEFDSKQKKEKAVVDAWKEYLDVLGSSDTMPQEQWQIKMPESLVELLHTMATVLDYEFDKTHIKNSSYAPRGHAQLEYELSEIRRGFLELLEGKRAIPIDVIPPQSPNPEMD